MPLFKCSASKAKPKNGIAYVTDETKAKIVTVNTSLPVKEHDEIMAFLKRKRISKVDLIRMGYQALLQETKESK